jgi:serine/threonine protein phosphatase 1
VWNLASLRTEKRPASVPQSTRIYAIGDLHGRVDLLDEVISHIDTDLARYPASRAVQIFLGDYVDRGPASRDVIDRLIERSRAHEMIFLKGNHESFLIEFLQNPNVLEDWRQFGGLETLISYGLNPSLNPGETERRNLATALAGVLPESHRQFLGALKPFYACGDFLFVHAGVKPGVPLAQQKEEDLLWIRDEFLACEDDFGKLVVHGHTPVRKPDVRTNRINIDTGAFATGRLTCLIIEGDKTLLMTEKRDWARNRNDKPSTPTRPRGKYERRR